MCAQVYALYFLDFKPNNLVIYTPFTRNSNFYGSSLANKTINNFKKSFFSPPDAILLCVGVRQSEN